MTYKVQAQDGQKIATPGPHTDQGAPSIVVAAFVSRLPHEGVAG